MVTGELHSIPLTLVNIYGPNFDNLQFFQKIFAQIPDMFQSNLIIVGDLNCVLDQYLDGSSYRQVNTYKCSELLNTYIKNTHIHDVWRTINPRTDYSLADSNLMP